MTMDMQFRLFFLLTLGFVTILKSEGITEDKLFLISPKQRSLSRNNSCMIRTEKSKVACCVCPGDCGKTYPRSVSKIYSKGVKVFRLYFAIRGPGEKSNFNVHLYICPRNSTSDVINQNCLLKNPLHIIRSFKNDKVLKLDVEVPRNLSCHHCLIQWAITKVVAPNASKLAKQYFGCLDIAILNENDRSYEPWEIGSGTEDSHSSTLSTSIGTTQAPFQTSHGITSPHSTTVSFCWAVGVYAKVPGLKEWCYINCMRGYCPRSHCQCVSKTTTSLSPSTSKLLTTPLPTTLKLVCHGTGLYAVVNGMNQWCQMNCLRGYCPKSHCKCTSGAQTPTTTPVALSLKTTKQIKIVCRAIGIQAIVPGMHRWCRINCKRGYCPVSHCKCSSSAEPTRPHQPPYITTPKFFTTKQVNPTTASTTSTLRSLTNTTITQSSAPTTVSINYSTAPPLRHKTKQMPLFLSLSKREAPLFSTFDELPATISWREENTSAKTDGSSPLVPISLYSASSSSTISLPTTSVTKETGRSSSDSTVTAESSPASTVTGGSVTTSAVTIKSDPATTMTSKTVSASTVTSKTSMASAVTNKSETIPTSKVISTTAQMTTRTLKTCTATDIFAGVVGMDHWCNINCNNGYCPKYQCKCDTLVATTVSTCRAIYPYDQMPNMHKWCKTNCAIGYCPSTHCQC